MFDELFALRESPSKWHWIGWSFVFVAGIGAAILLWPTRWIIAPAILVVLSASTLLFHLLKLIAPTSLNDVCTNCGRRYRGARRQIINDAPYGKRIIVINVCVECYTHPDRLSPTLVAINLTRPWGKELADEAGVAVAQYKKLTA